MEDLYDEMFRRKSVRRFSLKLTQGDLEMIDGVKAHLSPLIDNAKYELSRVEKNGKGEYSLALYGQDATPLNLMNAGYLLEQTDLYLEKNGIGCCFLGMAKPKQVQCADLYYLIMLDVGKSDLQTDFRTSDSQFMRNPIADTWEGDFDADVKEAARLSPSGINGQPWFVRSSLKTIEVFYKKPLLYKMLRRMNYIDLGIFLCHLDLALNKKGIKYSRIVSLGDESQKLVPVAVYYI